MKWHGYVKIKGQVINNLYKEEHYHHENIISEKDDILDAFAYYQDRNLD